MVANRSKPQGYDYYCKECARRRDREKYKKNYIDRGISYYENKIKEYKEIIKFIKDCR